MIKCERCGGNAEYRINKRFCSEHCRKLEEKKRYRLKVKQKAS